MNKILTEIPCPWCESKLTRERWGRDLATGVKEYRWACSKCKFTMILPEGELPTEDKERMKNNRI